MIIEALPPTPREKRERVWTATQHYSKPCLARSFSPSGFILQPIRGFPFGSRPWASGGRVYEGGSGARPPRSLAARPHGDTISLALVRQAYLKVQARPLPSPPVSPPPAPWVAGGLPRRPGFLGLGQSSCASRSMLKQVSVNRAEHAACFWFCFSLCLFVCFLVVSIWAWSVSRLFR